MNKLILFIGLFNAYMAIGVVAQVTVEADDAVIISADSAAAEASDVNTRLFTNDANTNNNIASGLLGVGLGVGGVLLVQAFQEAEENKKRCNPYYNLRHKRDDAVMGRLFGLGGGSNRPPKPCPPRYPAGPAYPHPHQHGGPYRPPPNNYQQPQPYPSNQGYAPNYPAPSYPNSGYRQPAPARPQVNYPTPAYNTPRQPAPAPAYTPTPSYPQQNAPYRPPSNQGYAPAFNGRSLAETEVKEVEKSSGGTGSLLGGSDRVVFGDK